MIWQYARFTCLTVEKQISSIKKPEVLEKNPNKLGQVIYFYLMFAW